MRFRVILPPNLWAAGGFTLPLNYQPAPRGFVVSLAGCERMFAYEPAFAQVARFIRENWAALAGSNRYLGGWRDAETGFYYLDVSETFADRGAALEAARQRGQLAAWDIDAGAEIRTEG